MQLQRPSFKELAHKSKGSIRQGREKGSKYEFDLDESCIEPDMEVTPIKQQPWIT